MLTSFAIIFLLGLTLGGIFRKLQLPSLMGMIFTGILLGPYALNRIDSSILNISTELRQIALVIILTRAGLALNIKELKKVGRPAILMSFVPVCFEIVGVLLIAPILLHVSLVEAAIMGAVLAAVSPAVIVPRMLKLIEEGRGTLKGIPQMLMAAASVDDVFVIVLFTSFTALAKGGAISLGSLMQIPMSIFTGILLGLCSGWLIEKLLCLFYMRDTVKAILLLCISFLLLSLEKNLVNSIPVSGLLAIMTMGAFIFKKNKDLASCLSNKYTELWIGAEILLFVLVGATVNMSYAMTAGISVLLVIMIAMLFRMGGVYTCLLKTNLNRKEKIFCMISYIPKATVQAAIGGIPLSMGLPCGEIILTIAVLAILITAPLGALGVDMNYKKLLQTTDKE